MAVVVQFDALPPEILKETHTQEAFYRLTGYHLNFEIMSNPEYNPVSLDQRHRADYVIYFSVAVPDEQAAVEFKLKWL